MPRARAPRRARASAPPRRAGRRRSSPRPAPSPGADELVHHAESAVDLHAALVGPQVAADDAQQRRLARAVRADERGRAPLGHAEGEVGEQRPPVGEREGDAVDVDEAHGCDSVRFAAIGHGARRAADQDTATRHPSPPAAPVRQAGAHATHRRRTARRPPHPHEREVALVTPPTCCRCPSPRWTTRSPSRSPRALHAAVDRSDTGYSSGSRPVAEAFQGFAADPARLGRRPGPRDLHRRREHGHRRGAPPGHRTRRRRHHHAAGLPPVLRPLPEAAVLGRRGAAPRGHRRGLVARPRRHRRGVRGRRPGDAALQSAQPDRARSRMPRRWPRSPTSPPGTT